MRRNTVIHVLAVAVSLALSTMVVPTRATAETLVGLTVTNMLVSFDSATPGTVTGIGPVTGLVAGDFLIGIDRRPSLGPTNGLVFGLGVNLATGSGRIYTVNEATAAATLVATLAADPTDATAPFPFTTVSGTAFGIDFNPVPDRLRVTSNTGQNLRINPDNGLVQLDVPLAYEAGDPNAGLAPAVTAVAYSNNMGGALLTTLRGVDTARNPDVLVVHTNPNGGTLQTSLVLPFGGADANAFDVSGLTGLPYFAVSFQIDDASDLYVVGPQGVTLIGEIGGDVPLRGLAAAVGAPIPEPSTAVLCVVGVAAALCVARRRRRRHGIALRA